MTRRRAALVAALAIAELAIGCSALNRQADATRYFVLTPLASPEPTSAGGFDRSVGIGPLTIPDHLNAYLVTRVAVEEIAISDTDRWSEPLREAVSRVLRQNLVALLGTERIVVYPWAPSAPPDLAVKVGVLQFQRTTQGTAEIAASWSIERGADRAPLSTKETFFSLPMRGTDTRAAVAALSIGLGQLSRQIATEIRRTSPVATTIAPARPR